MNENEFGYRVRLALNEGAERLDYKTAYRLEQARRKALGLHRRATAPAWNAVPVAAGGPAFPEEGGASWAQRLGLAAPLLALVIGFIGIYQWQHDQHISQLADIDFAVLLDEGPIDAYADKGFGALLQTNTEEL
ncbi:MAG: DUF3619 family protein [Burkholderiaceae bacterium]|jgi:hypothetical protein|nr:DUF3619 family protein [Burkholderiaceae bacterium]